MFVFVSVLSLLLFSFVSVSISYGVGISPLHDPSDASRSLGELERTSNVVRRATNDAITDHTTRVAFPS